MTGFLAFLAIVTGVLGFISMLAGVINGLNVWFIEGDFGAGLFILTVLGIIGAGLLWISAALYPNVAADNLQHSKVHNEHILEMREVCRTKFTDQAALVACMNDAGTLDVSAL